MTRPMLPQDRVPDWRVVPHIGAAEICRLAKISRPTLTRRVQAGKYPKPVDRGRETLISRRAVYQALGIRSDKPNADEEKLWERGTRLLQESIEAEERERLAKQRRGLKER